VNTELTTSEIAADALYARMKGEAQMNALMDSADAIHDAVLRGHVTSMIFSAIVNANDTVDVEQAAGNDEWLSLAKRTLAMEIDCDDHAASEEARQWFIDASCKVAA
jgi:hypothetical protein